MKRMLLLLVTLFFSTFALAVVNINTATKEELDVLPGIGPVKAQAIVDHRKANGPFKTPEDVMKVKGIKEGEFAKLKGEISVSGASAAPAAAKAAEPAKAAKSDTAMKAEPKAAAKTESTMKAESKAADTSKMAKDDKAAATEKPKDEKTAKADAAKASEKSTAKSTAKSDDKAMTTTK